MPAEVAARLLETTHCGGAETQDKLPTAAGERKAPESMHSPPFEGGGGGIVTEFGITCTHKRSNQQGPTV